MVDALTHRCCQGLVMVQAVRTAGAGASKKVWMDADLEPASHITGGSWFDTPPPPPPPHTSPPRRTHCASLLCQLPRTMLALIVVPSCCAPHHFTQGWLRNWSG